jgi:hypothetical protein
VLYIVSVELSTFIITLFRKIMRLVTNYMMRSLMICKSRRMRWVGHAARMGERRGVCWALVGKPEGKKPHVRPRRRWEDTIKIDFQEVECGVMNLIELTQDRYNWRGLVKAVMNLRVPQNFLTS